MASKLILAFILPLQILFFASLSSSANIQTFFPSLPSPAFTNFPTPTPSPSPSSFSSQPSQRSDSKVKLTKAIVGTAVGSFGLSGLLFLAFLCFTARKRDPNSIPSKSNSRRSVFDEAGLNARPPWSGEFGGRRCPHCNKLLTSVSDRDVTSNSSSLKASRQEETEVEVVTEPNSPARRRIQEAPLLPANSVRSNSKIFLGGSLTSSDRLSSSSTISPPLLDAAAPARQSSAASSAASRRTAAPMAVQFNVSSQNSLRTHSDKSNTAPPVFPVQFDSPAQISGRTDDSDEPTLLNSVHTNAPAVTPVQFDSPARNSRRGEEDTMISDVSEATEPTKGLNSDAVETRGPPPPPPAPPARTTAAAGGGGAPVLPPPPPAPGGGRQSFVASRPPATPVTASAGQKKMKPLHWDKLNPGELEHSVVWNKMSGSFQFDEDIMEALFGTVATNMRKPKAMNTNTTTFTSTSTASNNNQAQICLLDPRKSQNVAIVLRSLSLSRHDVLSALKEGRGLTVEVLEKLTRIAPTKEEEALITSYSGNPTRLADAESFLYHILRTVPSPFARLHAMLFKANYEPEVKHHKQSLLTLELACNELKNRGIFLKLLEVVLKAGNRMNAGTSRGNAQAFNLSALNKLADVKSTDGSTTLLHFVVQEVVRSEGKQLVLNRNHSLRRSQSGSSSSDAASATLNRAGSRAERREEREFEYVKYGLPIVGGLSSEFSNVKKAAGVDYDMLVSTCSTLEVRVNELKRFLETCGDDGFVAEMKRFVQRAEEDLRLLKEEQGRVLELVRRTTAYYQPGAAKEKGAQPLMLFVIVSDFLAMVDKACVDIARGQQQRKKKGMQAVGSGSKTGITPPPEALRRVSRPVVKFPNLPAHFMSDNSNSDSSSDEENG